MKISTILVLAVPALVLAGCHKKAPEPAATDTTEAATAAPAPAASDASAAATAAPATDASASAT